MEIVYVADDDNFEVASSATASFVVDRDARSCSCKIWQLKGIPVRVLNLFGDCSKSIFVAISDSEGRSPLHWAVDRGHLDMVELLLSKNADVNAQDNEGQTPLHYAAMCDREAIAEILVKQNADTDVKDNDGCSASDLCESNWSWLHSSSRK